MKASNAIVLLDNDFETRYYRTPKTALNGIKGWGHKNFGSGPDTKVLVYRLDQDATDALNREAYAHLPDLTRGATRKPPPEKGLLDLLTRMFS